MRRLKVLQVVSVPGVGGAQVYVESVVQRLVGLGYDVTVMCSDDPTVVARYARMARVHPTPIPYRAAPWSDVRFFVRLLRLMRRERFDVVQTSAAKASLFGRLAARLARVPVVIFTAHGFPFHDFMPLLPRLGLRMLERVMSRWCTDMVVSVSEVDRRAAVAEGIVPPERIITIQNGIDLGGPVAARAAARESLGLAPEGPVVGIVGRLAPQKAPADFLRAAALIAREVPAATFLVVGDGPLRSDLERLAGELGLDRQVRFLGFRDDVPRVLAALDVFALTSLWEGLPFTVLEAMRAGTPVVATEVNGVSDVVEHGRTGLLARPRDTAQLAAHVIALLKDPGRARVMGEAGQRRVRQRFDVDRMVSELSDLYQRLHAARRPASRGAPGGGPVASDRVAGGAVR
jgi:glycosyltransferase involved in cell wall biosynthesis